jgi:uncharacterized protein (TIGR00251 family)
MAAALRAAPPGWRGGRASAIIPIVADAQIEVRLRPRGSRDELIEMRDGILQARVTAPPVDGKANRALCKMIAKRLGVAPSKVSVVRGERSRDKLVRVEGMGQATLEKALGGGGFLG